MISGNVTGVGIVGPLASGNHVAGNYVGLGSDGFTVVENQVGIAIVGDLALRGAPGNIIGGTTEAERNVISGNFLSNVFLARTKGTIVQANYIGTDWTGTQGRGGRVGIRLEDDRGSLIGGAAFVLGNVIAGNTEAGIRLDGVWISGGTHGTRVEGNRIGTTADGQGQLWNRVGIEVSGHIDSDQVLHEIVDVTIGGPGAGNLISGNLNQGIRVFGAGVQNLRIQGNLIGTDFDGAEAVPNGIGVLLHDAAGVQIGGTDKFARNVIAGNSGNGIAMAVTWLCSRAFDPTCSPPAVKRQAGLGERIGGAVTPVRGSPS